MSAMPMSLMVVLRPFDPPLEVNLGMAMASNMRWSSLTGGIVLRARGSTPDLKSCLWSPLPTDRVVAVSFASALWEVLLLDDILTLLFRVVSSLRRWYSHGLPRCLRGAVGIAMGILRCRGSAILLRARWSLPV